MLFDLRSRGRRTTVRGVYLTAGRPHGRRPDPVRRGHRGERRRTAERVQRQRRRQPEADVSAPRRAPRRPSRANPNSAAAWAKLVQAHWTSAGQGGNYDAATQTFHGLRQEGAGQGRPGLAALHPAHRRQGPQGDRRPGRRAYASVGNYAGEAGAWEVETATHAPGRSRPMSAWPSPPTRPDRPGRAIWP